MLSVEYRVPTQGLGTDFTTNERPLTFAAVYTNRFRNVTGGAEKRPGMNVFSPAVTGAPNLTRLHEYVDQFGNETLFTSDDNGNLWRYDGSAAFVSALTGKSQVRMLSAETQGKLIFVNGVDRNFYTGDAGQTFQELKGLIADGIEAGGSNATTLIDGNVANWISQTEVSDNDFVYNSTLNAYGIVVTVASAAITHTTIGSAGNGAGKATRDQQPGDAYQLIDYINLEVFPNGAGGFTSVSTATSGTSSTVVSVSGVDFSNIPGAAQEAVMLGDFVYDTTQGAVSMISSVSANINVNPAINGMVSGDALTLFRAAMPIATWVHVHYGRAYFVDNRNQTNVVITAPDDPQDVTTFQQTLQSSSFSFGTEQPTGDIILALTSFQRFFVASGEKNLYIYQGINPIQDSSSTVEDWTPISFYPNGIASRFGMCTNGTDLLHVAKEGLQAVNIGTVTNTTIQNNVSLPVRTALLNLISSLTDSDDCQLTFYPRRNWLIVKIGSNCYILNSNPSYNQDGQQQNPLSWHLFTGKWAEQNHYFVRRNGDLLACGPNGMVYQMDSSASTDNGNIVQTDLVMPWVRLEEPQRSIRIKEGYYIRPVFESDPTVEYTINVNAGLDNFSQDSITAAAGNTGAIGSFIIGTTPIGAGGYAQTQKYPLRWRGEQAQVEFISNSSASPDIITSFVMFGDITGRR